MITNLFGITRHGKTTMLRKLLRERRRPALVISFDKSLVADFPPRHRFRSARALLDFIIASGGISINHPLCLSILADDQKRLDAEFELACRIAIEHQNLMLIIDEVDMFDAADSKASRLYRVVNYQAHEFGGFLDLITASRRPANVGRDLRSQTHVFYLFCLTDERDLDYVRRNVSPAIVERVRTLPQFHYLKYNVIEKTVTPGIVRP